MSLTHRLDDHLERGKVNEMAITRAMNEVIGRSAPGQEVMARFRAVSAVSGAMLRLLWRRRRKSLLAGRFVRAWNLTILAGVIMEWIVEREQAPLDPDADVLRIELLRLQLSEASGLLPEVSSLSPAAAAMARIGLAGTSPLQQRCGR